MKLLIYLGILLSRCSDTLGLIQYNCLGRNIVRMGVFGGGGWDLGKRRRGVGTINVFTHSKFGPLSK